MYENIIALTVVNDGKLVFSGTVNGLQMAVTVYRAIMDTLLTDEESAEKVVGKAETLSNDGYLIPFVYPANGRLLTIDELSALGAMVPEQPLLYTWPIEEKAHAS